MPTPDTRDQAPDAAVGATANLHTHTRLCKHADGDVDDYCREAVRQGLTVLGITDHTPLPDDRWSSVRMHPCDLSAYCQAITAVGQAYPGLRTLAGMECDYAPEYESYFRDELLARCGLVYLVGAVHWFPHEGRWVGAYGGTGTPERLRSYARWVVRAMESGLFAFQAHPDLFANAYLTWDRHAEACSREMLTAAAALGVPLEINGYGFRKPPVATPDGPRPLYPWTRFWDLAAEYGVAVVVTSDAHRPADVTAAMAQAQAIADARGLRVAPLADRLGGATGAPAAEAAGT